MKTTSKIGLAMLCLIALCSFGLQTEKQIDKAQWLVGTWENKMPEGNIYETWKKVSDMEMHGQSYMLKNKDTVLFETVKLIQKADNLYYIPIVKGQNDGQAVRFALKSITDDMMVFENLKHDFPQRISYQRTAPDALLAEISNEKGNKKQYFPMKKIK